MRFIAISLMILSGCGSSISQPANVLTGTWGGMHVELNATSTQAKLRFPCLTIQFPAIVPNSEMELEITGTIVAASWDGAIGKEYRIAGKISGSTLTIMGQALFTEDWTDPESFILEEGAEGDFSTNTFCPV